MRFRRPRVQSPFIQDGRMSGRYGVRRALPEAKGSSQGEVDAYEFARLRLSRGTSRARSCSWRRINRLLTQSGACSGSPDVGLGAVVDLRYYDVLSTSARRCSSRASTSDR
jgi:hypothetical protein